MDGFFAHTYSSVSRNQFGLYDKKFNKQKTVPVDLPAFRDDPRYDNKVVMRKVGDEIFCLQQYGTGYLVFDHSGELTRRGSVLYDPFALEAYRDLDVKYSFPSFGVVGNKIYACVAGKESFDILELDTFGSLLNKENIRVDEHYSDTRVIPRDVLACRVDGHVYLFALLWGDDFRIARVDLDLSFGK